jgi:hypothetical protein
MHPSIAQPDRAGRENAGAVVTTNQMRSENFSVTPPIFCSPPLLQALDNFKPRFNSTMKRKAEEFVESNGSKKRLLAENDVKSQFDAVLFDSARLLNFKTQYAKSEPYVIPNCSVLSRMVLILLLAISMASYITS